MPKAVRSVAVEGSVKAPTLGNKTYTANSNKLATANGQTVTLDQVGNISLLRGLSLDWNQAGHLKSVT